MKHSEFRALETNSSTDRIDAVLTGAVAAFSSLTRPRRQDLAQLEDLAIPLLACASDRAKRHAAAALSEHPSAPKALVLALAQEAIEIAAPLLLRSPVLTGADLVALVHRCGLEHARAIAKRKSHPAELVALLGSLSDPAVTRALSLGASGPAGSASSNEATAATSSKAFGAGGGRLEEVHAALRDMMRASAEAGPAAKLDPAGLIREALNDSGPLFQTALADALGVSFRRAGQIIAERPGSDLFFAFSALGLSFAEAYFAIGLIYGASEASREDLKAFAQSYTAIDAETARATVRRWKAQEISDHLRHRRIARRG